MYVCMNLHMYTQKSTVVEVHQTLSTVIVYSNACKYTLNMLFKIKKTLNKVKLIQS